MLSILIKIFKINSLILIVKKRAYFKYLIDLAALYGPDFGAKMPGFIHFYDGQALVPLIYFGVVHLAGQVAQGSAPKYLAADLLERFCLIAMKMADDKVIEDIFKNHVADVLGIV